MSKSLDPEQALQNVRPDLGPKCLQMTKFAANKISNYFSMKKTPGKYLYTCTIIFILW